MYHLHLGQVANLIVGDRLKQAELARLSKQNRIKKKPWLKVLREKIRTRLQSWFVQEEKARSMPESLTSDCLTADC